MLPVIVTMLTAASGMTPVVGDTPGNLLFVVLDDVGIDRVGVYGEHPSPPPTPTIDQLAAVGVLFRNCWANPICSSTRATLMTGRYSYRTHIGWWLGEDAVTPGLSLAEQTLPEVIATGAPGVYQNAMVGKWHLAGFGHGPLNPNKQGFEHYAGALTNLGPDHDPEVYYAFDKVVDGLAHPVRRYATTDTVDDALRIADGFADEPWLLVVSFHAAHTPYHRPPPDLHSLTLGGDPDLTPIPHHEAAVEALDRELGRLLAGLGDDLLAETTVVVVGDNGTQNLALEPPWPAGHGKGSLYQPGVRVPLIIAGRGVPAMGEECVALVNTVDLLPTLCELAGVDAQAVIGPDVTLDGLSVVPYLTTPDLPSLHETVYAEAFKPNGQGPYTVHRRAVRDQRYKLIRDQLTGQEQLYDLAVDRFEQDDLLSGDMTTEQRTRWHELRLLLADYVE